jgi:hypothetical protein
MFIGRSEAVPRWMVTGQAKIAALTRVVPRESKILEMHFDTFDSPSS